MAARIAVGANAAVRQTSHSRQASVCGGCGVGLLPACDRAASLAFFPGFGAGRDVDVKGVQQYDQFFSKSLQKSRHRPLTQRPRHVRQKW